MTEVSGLSVLTCEHREVGLVVVPDHLGRELAAVVEVDGDLVGALDDVIVGDDDAGRVDDEAGAERLDPARTVVLRGRPRRPVLPRNSSKKCWNGEPSGKLRRRHGAAAPPEPVTVCDVEMLTTASSSGAATSATNSGPRASGRADDGRRRQDHRRLRLRTRRAGRHPGKFGAIRLTSWFGVRQARRRLPARRRPARGTIGVAIMLEIRPKSDSPQGHDAGHGLAAGRRVRALQPARV